MIEEIYDSQGRTQAAGVRIAVNLRGRGITSTVGED